MKQQWQDVITDAINDARGEEVGFMHKINSALVSAQNRKRLYWTNIPIEQPEDKGILLKDIVMKDVYPVALHNLYGGFKEKSVRVFEGKSPTIRTASGGGHIPSFVKHKLVKKFYPDRVVGRRLNEEGKRDDYNPGIKPVQMVEITDNEKSHCISTVAKDSMVVDTEKLLLSGKAIEYMNRKVKGGRTHWDFLHHSDVRNEKLATMVADFFKGVPYNVFKDWDVIRKFHPIECERLQTFTDNYTKGISNTQRYKALGNSFTVDVIAHILGGMTND